MPRLKTLRLASSVCFLLFAGGAYAQTEFLAPSDAYPTIQDAIDDAVAGDTVTVARGTYTESFDLKADVIVQGEETAATFLTGDVGGTGGTLQRFTLESPAFQFSGATNLAIRNCVVRGATGRAIEITNSRGTRIVNNVFYDNATALWFENVDGFTESSGEVTANAFVANNTSLRAPMNPVLKAFNLHFGNADPGDTDDTDLVDVNPLFVNASTGDFHLQVDSGCRDAVTDGSLSDPDDTEADCGAYGGPNTDQLPAPVTDVTATAAGGDSVKVDWNASADYLVTGYKLFYGRASGDTAGTGAAEGPSPIEVEGGTTATSTLTGLPVDTTPPPAPANVTTGPGDGRIQLSWDTAAGATGYTVLYGTESGSYSQARDVGDATTFVLTGLSNDVPYFLAVRSYVSTAYFLTVSAVGTPDADTGLAKDGRKAEASSVSLGKTDGEQSAEVSETPEQVAGFPDLEDSGFCFVAALCPSGPRAGAGAFWPGLFILGSLAACAAISRKVPKSLLFLAVGLLAVTGTARAQTARWSLDARAGAFLPADSQWSDHFDDDTLLDLKLGLGYHLTSWIELGAEAGFRRAEGTVTTTVSGRPLAQQLDQTLTVYPLQIYAKLNLQFTEQQLLIPYLAAGPSRYLYRHEVEGGDTREGHRDGFHVRGGLRLSLSRFDAARAARARSQFGVVGSGLTLEGQYTQVDDFGSADTDLGGWSIFGGFDVQF